MTKRQRWAIAIDVGTTLILIAVYVWFSKDRPPFVMSFWHRVMTTCYATARKAGHVGMLAETAYTKAAEKARV